VKWPHGKAHVHAETNIRGAPHPWSDKAVCGESLNLFSYDEHGYEATEYQASEEAEIATCEDCLRAFGKEDLKP